MAARYRSSRRRAAGPPSASRSRWRPRCSAQARVRFWSRRGPRRRGLAGGQPGNIGIHVAGSSRCQPKALLCVLGGAGATAYKWFVRKPAAQAAVPDDRSLMHTARFTRPLAAAAGLAALLILAAASAGSATASSAKHDAAVHTHPAILLPGGNPTGSESGSTQHSNNWAGYAAFPQNSGGSFRYVQADPVHGEGVRGDRAVDRRDRERGLDVAEAAAGVLRECGVSGPVVAVLRAPALAPNRVPAGQQDGRMRMYGGVVLGRGRRGTAGRCRREDHQRSEAGGGRERTGESCGVHEAPIIGHGSLRGWLSDKPFIRSRACAAEHA